MTAEAKIKGAVLYSSKKYLLEHYGKEIVHEIVKKTDDETKKLFDSAILSNEWYSAKIMASFAEAVRDYFGAKTFNEVIRGMAKMQLKTVITIYMKIFVTPNKYGEMSPKIWESLHNLGELIHVETTENSQTIKVINYPWVSDHSKEFFGEYRCGILETMGKKNLRHAFRDTGSDEVTFQFTWM